MGLVVAFGDLQGTRVGGGGRAELDLELALVGPVAHLLGEVGTGEARCDAHDVVERLPDGLDRGGDGEGLLELHGGGDSS